MSFRVMLILTITLSAMAAEVRLGPEIPLSAEMKVEAAAYSQEPLAVASSGGEFLALWQTSHSSERSFHLERIGSTKPGYVIPNAGTAVMASSGDGYLVAWASGTKIYAQNAASDGRLLGEARVVASQSESSHVTHLLFNGSMYLLLAWGKALILDRDGTIVRELPPFSGLDPRDQPVVWAGVQNGEFLVLEAGYTLHRFSAFGPREDFPLSISGSATPWFVAASSDRILFGDPQSVKLLDTVGHVVSQTNQTCTLNGIRSASAWWDGSHFVSTCVDSSGRLSATRYTNDGTPDGGATLLSSTANLAPLFATNGTDQLLVWADRHFSEDSDVVARVVHGSDSVAAGADLQLESYSTPAQRWVQIARAGAHRLAVWVVWGGPNFESALDGRTVFAQPLIGRPAVVAGTRSFLTVWNDYDTSALLARRVGLAGELLDPQPRVLATDVEVFQDALPGVGFRAPLFVVAVPGAPPPSLPYAPAPVRARGITEDGELVDVTPPGGSHYMILKPMWNGSELQFANGLLGGGLVGFFERYFLFGIARPGAASVDVIRSGEFCNGCPQAGAIAQGPDRLTFVWVETPPSGKLVAFAQSTLDGRLLRGRTVATEANAGEIEAVWNGGEFVIAWSDGNRIRAMRFDLSGQPLDATPFDISPPGATVDRPSFAVTATGVDVAYSRADEQAGGVARAFVRSLDRVLPLVPRRPAVRH